MKARDRPRPSFSRSNPFGKPPKSKIPDWGKLQGKKKSKKKKGQWKCGLKWKERGCVCGKAGKRCRKQWHKANPPKAPEPDDPTDPLIVVGKLKYKTPAYEDAMRFIKERTGHESTKMESSWYVKGKGLLGCHSTKGVRKMKNKRDKSNCFNIMKAAKAWIQRQAQYAKSGIAHFAKSAGVGDKDTAGASKSKKKSRKSKKKSNVDKDGFPKPPPGWGKPIKKRGRFSPGAKQRRNRRRRR